MTKTAPVFLIAGPTASGKSALAASLARKLGGAVINADSMQVYRDLRILTARPTRDEARDVPHLLFGYVDGAENYSVGRWLKDFRLTLAELAARGQPAVVAGGTGMYFLSALCGLSDIPAVPRDIRERVRAMAQGRAPQELHAELRRQDPETAARLRDTDPQRVLRALEVFAATGTALARLQRIRAAPVLGAGDYPAFFLAPARAELYARIDARFDKMIAQGALDEVRALAARKLDSASPVMRAHGAPHLIAHIEGRLSLGEAVARAKADTRQYAKRQFTFARHQLPRFTWLESAEEIAGLIERLAP